MTDFGGETTSTPTRRTAPTAAPFSNTVRRNYAIFTGLAVLFIFLQSITAGNFIEDGLPDSTKQMWVDAHGGMAYPIMLFSLLAAITAVLKLKAVGRLRIFASLAFVATLLQWLSGHAISGLGMDWMTPFHVALAFIIYGLAIWLSVQSARLRRDYI